MSGCSRFVILSETKDLLIIFCEHLKVCAGMFAHRTQFRCLLSFKHIAAVPAVPLYREHPF